jgi:hypothetical protein
MQNGVRVFKESNRQESQILRPEANHNYLLDPNFHHAQIGERLLMTSITSKRVVGAVVVLQLVVMVILWTRNRVAERLITEAIRSQLVAETTMMSVYQRELAAGRVESVKQIMQAKVSSNLAALRDGVYGKLDPQQLEALKVTLREAAAGTNTQDQLKP